MESLYQSTKQKLSDSDSTIEKLEADNVELYTKLKFIQSSSPLDSLHMAGSLSSQRRSQHWDVESGQNSSLQLRFQNKYESNISPLVKLNQLDRQKRAQELSVAEKILLNSTVTCVSTKVGRSVLVVYLGAMHLLVFVTLYFVAHHHSTTGCDFSESGSHP